MILQTDVAFDTVDITKRLDMNGSDFNDVLTLIGNRSGVRTLLSELVYCQTCGASVGAVCKTSSGRKRDRKNPHVARWYDAFSLVTNLWDTELPD